MIRLFDLFDLRRMSLVFVSLLFSVSGNLAAQIPRPVQIQTRPATTNRLTKRQQRYLIRYNEAGAIKTLFTLLSAEATYQSTAGNGDYGSIEELGKQQLIDYVLAEGHRYGYLFRVRQEKFSSKSPASYEVFAVPRTYGQTGRRSFYMDQTGVIRFVDKKGAEANRADDLMEIDP